MNRENKKEII